jgi:hypothetical protein
VKRGAICGDKRVACIPSKAAEERPLLASVKSGNPRSEKQLRRHFFVTLPKFFKSNITERLEVSSQKRAIQKTPEQEGNESYE